jgi:hypothetical protein
MNLAGIGSCEMIGPADTFCTKIAGSRLRSTNLIRFLRPRKRPNGLIRRVQGYIEMMSEK